jgi:TonB family protein
LTDEAEAEVAVGDFTLALQFVRGRTRAGRPGAWLRQAAPLAAIALAVATAIIVLVAVARWLEPRFASRSASHAPSVASTAATTTADNPGTGPELLPPIALVGSLSAPPPAQLPTADHSPASAGTLRANVLPAVAVRVLPTGAALGERAPRWRGKPLSYAPDGALSANVVAAEIERRKDAIVSAYEHALRRNPELAGQIEVRFKIDARGQVRDVVITRDTLGDTATSERVKSVLASWRFPAPRDGDEYFAYPFTFRPALR